MGGRGGVSHMKVSDENSLKLIPKDFTRENGRGLPALSFSKGKTVGTRLEDARHLA